jgi:hypothetical protein
MEMNWKDLILTFVIAFLLFIVWFWFMNTVYPHICLNMVFISLLLMVPGLFYFQRNPCSMRSALAVSIIFGFLIWPIGIFYDIPYVLTSETTYVLPTYLVLWAIVGSATASITFCSFLLNRYIIKSKRSP